MNFRSFYVEVTNRDVPSICAKMAMILSCIIQLFGVAMKGRGQMGFNESQNFHFIHHLN